MGGLEGKVFGSRSAYEPSTWPRAKYFPHVRPNSVNKYFITPPFLYLVVLEYFEKLPVNTHSINRASALNEQMEFVGPEGFFRTGSRQPTGP